jgi:hypothetical protein
MHALRKLTRECIFKSCQHLFSAYLLRVKKVGRFIRRPKQVCPELSAHVGDALLGIRLSRGRWLRRQLKHRCLLTLAQVVRFTICPSGNSSAS